MWFSVLQYEDQSNEHHDDEANLDQSCRSTKVICYLKEDESEFLEERRQKELVNEFAALTISESVFQHDDVCPTMCEIV